MKIYIDIGHGENGDPGAVSGSFKEHQMNIVTGEACAKRLGQYGYTVMVEKGDLSISASAKAANAFGADLLISCHYNAGGGDRGEIIYSWKKGSLALANTVFQGLINAGQTKVNIIKCKANSAGTAEYFGILRTSTMPAVIVEPCFIDNEADRTLADTLAEQKNIGVCIADSIAHLYGGYSTRKEESKLAEAKDNTPDSYAKEAVDWAVENGLLYGNAEGNYMLHSPVTRQNLMVFLHRFAKLQESK